MVVDALAKSEKEAYTLVSLTADDGELVEAYTDWGSDVSFEGLEYSSELGLKVTLPDNVGTLERRFCDIQIPLEASSVLLPQSIRSTPHSQIEVAVTEIIRPHVPGPAQNILHSFLGKVERVVKNPTGIKSMVRLRCTSLKSQIKDVSLGVTCNHQCVNRLGDSGCTVDMGTIPKRISATLTSILRQKITVTDAAVSSGLGDRFYHRGYVARRGLHIGIQEWRDEVNGTKNEFFLVRQPPPEWENQTVTIFAGCDKTIETCRARFTPGSGGVPANTTGNESNFKGLGYNMPAYNPQFEDARGRGNT